LWIKLPKFIVGNEGSSKESTAASVPQEVPAQDVMLHYIDSVQKINLMLYYKFNPGLT
jgi:hypothetical protein